MHVRPTDVQTAPRRSRRRSASQVIGLLAAGTALSACGAAGAQGELGNGYLPHGVTENSQRVETLWIYAWIAALAVGALVLALAFWCVVAYRRKKGDEELPLQLQYNVPLEILYTVVPMFMIAVLFYWTAKDQNALMDTTAEPDVTINVVGKQWSWDFNYVDADVHESGTQAQLTGEPGVEEELPTLYLPVDKRVEFQLTARDVIHSFWVPQFLQKLDMMPGRVNTFQVVPTEEGTFAGKCAELCGAYHSQMLFNVKVVDQATYDAHLEDLRKAGNTGLLGNDLNREGIVEKDEHLLSENEGK
ncbi:MULTISPECIES: aa3-type cytochrome oxidase subunit II [unclassified Janibacter]|uniref:aa3-type cytochrome oxidase subunit II n=1 Tax=unclassified Janibacter TaxID=2649294 RepID=UPI003CFFBDF9